MPFQDRLELSGAPGSPYTRKMVAVLRYRHIPHSILWGTMRDARTDLPQPKVSLLPTFYFRDGGEVKAVVDSTPIIRRLEGEYEGRSILPADPALGFINALIEDYGDEWLTKAMFHYRWAFEDDIQNAGPLLAAWHDPTAPGETIEQFAEAFSKRQIERLWVVGSNATTAPVIEESFTRFLTILDGLIEGRGYVLGSRPASCDFALYGQLTQLVGVEPTSMKLARNTAPRIRAWVDRVDDLSGLAPADDGFMDLAAEGEVLKPLLTEIGRTYVPALLANAAALAKGEENFTTTIDGKEWTQKAFPYQAKCLGWLREDHAALSDGDRARVDALLKDTGVEALFG